MVNYKRRKFLKDKGKIF